MRHFVRITVLLLLSAAAPAFAMSTSDCYDCHSDDSLTKTVGGREISLFVDEEVYASSVHGDMDCTDCHEDLADVEDMHEENLRSVDCGICHDDAAEEVEAGGHMADCTDCHGIHDILPASDPDSSVHDLRVSSTCCECHSEYDSSCSAWEAGVHGVMIREDEVDASAACNDCHGSHDIRGADEEESMVARDAINATCGVCHPQAVETFSASIHGTALAGGDGNAPVCTSCHSPHHTEAASEEEFQLTVVDRCSACHEDMAYSFSKNYHGQLTWFGSTKVAQCIECHGAHDILPEEDPESMIHPDNLVATCATCHPGANENFILYMPHADYHDAEQYPLLHYLYLAMVFLLSTVFLFFGIHTLLWFLRSFREYRNRSGSR